MDSAVNQEFPLCLIFKKTAKQSGRKLNGGNPSRNSMAEKEASDSEEKQSQIVGVTSQEMPLNAIVGAVCTNEGDQRSRKSGKKIKTINQEPAMSSI